MDFRKRRNTKSLKGVEMLRNAFREGVVEFVRRSHKDLTFQNFEYVFTISIKEFKEKGGVITAFEPWFGKPVSRISFGDGFIDIKDGGALAKWV